MRRGDGWRASDSVSNADCDCESLSSESVVSVCCRSGGVMRLCSDVSSIIFSYRLSAAVSKYTFFGPDNSFCQGIFAIPKERPVLDSSDTGSFERRAVSTLLVILDRGRTQLVVGLVVPSESKDATCERSSPGTSPFLEFTGRMGASKEGADGLAACIPDGRG